MRLSSAVVRVTRTARRWKVIDHARRRSDSCSDRLRDCVLTGQINNPPAVESSATYRPAIPRITPERKLGMENMKKNDFFLVAALVLVLGFTSASSEAQTFRQLKLAPDALTSSALFGFVTASSQQVLAVGAPLQSSVYLYVRNGSNWVPDGVITDFGLGNGVAVDGNVVALSSARGPLVYSRQNGSWVQQAQLTNNAASGFGAIGMRKGRVAAASNGAVFIFEQNELTLAWSQVAQLTVPGGSGSGFGISLSLTDNTLAVGEPFVNGGTGAVHVYTPQAGFWTEQAVLHSNDSVGGTNFGLGLSVSGNTIVVGAPGPGFDGDLPGWAFVFVSDHGLWAQQARLESPSLAPEQDFGTSLALIGNTLLVGAYENNNDIGTAHIFVRSGSSWSLTASLFPDDGTPGQRFANNVTMPDANTFVCSSPTASLPDKFNAGAVYVYQK